jgi:ABC-type nitrate/sulfonate/bicarbonate transport system substrate-binding protein
MKHAIKTSFLTAGFTLLVSTAPADTTKVVIGGGPYLDIPQLSVAMDKNLWAEHELEAEIIPFRSGRAAFEALLGGGLDLAFMAEFPAVIGAMREQNFKVIAEMSQYKATRIIHGGDPEIDTVAELAGKPVGLTAGTNVHYMFEIELAAAGVEVEIVSVGPPDIVPALVRGDIFAGAMFPSFYAGAKKALGDKYSGIPINSYGTHFILVATQKLIDENPDAVTNALKALYAGEQVVKSDPAASHQSVSNVLGGTLKPEDVASASENYAFNMQINQEMLELMVDEGEWINARGSIKGDPPTIDSIRPYIDGSFLASIDESRVSLN